MTRAAAASVLQEAQAANVGAAAPCIADPSIAVHRLTLTDFRSYAHLRLDCDSRPVVVTGDNGAGKTNLLEALSFLVPGRGLRRARGAELARQAAGPDAGWAVAAEVARGSESFAIGTGREAGSGDKRAVHIDGRPVRSQAILARAVHALWLTPAMDRLFLEAPSARRRFFDRLVYGLDPDQVGRLAAYDHALRERARLLAEGRGDDAWLAALEDTMARHGVAAAAARRDALRRLAEALRESDDAFPRAELALTGGIESWLDDMPALDAEDRMRASLAEARAQDAIHGGAAVGPHRTDLAARHLGRDMSAALCSTGEQKALLAAVLLAQVRVLTQANGVAPLLLLDEAAAHFDAKRRDALFDRVAALRVQTWITGAERGLFSALEGRAQFFRVADAAVMAV